MSQVCTDWIGEKTGRKVHKCWATIGLWVSILLRPFPADPNRIRLVFLVVFSHLINDFVSSCTEVDEGREVNARQWRAGRPGLERTRALAHSGERYEFVTRETTCLLIVRVFVNYDASDTCRRYLDRYLSGYQDRFAQVYLEVHRVTGVNINNTNGGSDD